MFAPRPVWYRNSLVEKQFYVQAFNRDQILMRKILISLTSAICIVFSHTANAQLSETEHNSTTHNPNEEEAGFVEKNPFLVGGGVLCLFALIFVPPAGVVACAIAVPGGLAVDATTDHG